MRNFLLFTFIFLLLGALGTFAWVSNNPESPHLERAQEWPVVGELARTIREVYLGPYSDESQSADSESVETRGVEEQNRAQVQADDTEDVILDLRGIDSDSPKEPVVVYKKPEDLTESERKAVEATLKRVEERHGKPKNVWPSEPAPPSSLRRPLPILASEWAWFLPGQPVQAASDAESETVDRLSQLSYLPVFIRVGSWAKVRYDGLDGWIDTRWQPPHSRKGARRGILRRRTSPIRRTNWQHVKVAKEILGVEKPSGEVAGFDIYTDLEDEDLVELLGSAAAQTEDAFFARFGRVPSQAPTYAMLVFSKTADYQRFTGATSNMSTLGHAGHAGQGLVAMTAEQPSRRQVASTLVHEITHMLIRRSLASGLPSWLNEGMATDLGSVWVEDSDDLVKDRLVQTAVPNLSSLGMRIMYLRSRLDSGEFTPLPVILSRTRDEFYRPGQGQESYAQSGAFIRYLMEGEDGVMAPAFLSFLDRVADGKEANLLGLVDRDSRQLDEGFRAWILEESEDLREGAIRRYQMGRTGPAGGG